MKTYEDPPLVSLLVAMHATMKAARTKTWHEEE